MISFDGEISFLEHFLWTECWRCFRTGDHNAVLYKPLRRGVFKRLFAAEQHIVGSILGLWPVTTLKVVISMSLVENWISDSCLEENSPTTRWNKDGSVFSVKKKKCWELNFALSLSWLPASKVQGEGSSDNWSYWLHVPCWSWLLIVRCLFLLWSSFWSFNRRLFFLAEES